MDQPVSPHALPPSPHTPQFSTNTMDDVPPPVPSKNHTMPQRSPKFFGGRLCIEPRSVDIRGMERPLNPYSSGTRYLERPPSPISIMERTREHYIPPRPRADSAPARTASQRRAEPVARPGSAEPAKRSRRKTDSISDSSLPSGVRPSEAPTHFPYSQLELLQSAAKLRSETFGVLNVKDVEGLSRELSALEARCQYLRETHKSLRTGRKTLHRRMLTYLRGTRSALFSRENLLKQEEALAELDAAIDDWGCKLEKVCQMAPGIALVASWLLTRRKAEKRRARVKEKLLEHVAAALTVSNFAYSPTERGFSTPPATPERRPVGDKESITIYALLADVTKS